MSCIDAQEEPRNLGSLDVSYKHFVFSIDFRFITFQREDVNHRGSLTSCVFDGDEVGRAQICRNYLRGWLHGVVSFSSFLISKFPLTLSL